MRNRVKKGHLKSAQLLNYEGHTFTTRFVHALIPKEFYHDSPGNFEKILAYLSTNARSCAEVGVEFEGRTFWACFVGCKGDMPFLVKAGRLERSFYNLPKQPTSKKPGRGICHLCLAGTAGVMFEDSSDGASHNLTVGEVAPWTTRPSMLVNAHDVSLPESFFQFDIWHCWHLGEGRNLVCTGMALFLDDVVQASSIPEALAQLFDDYCSFCQRARRQRYLLAFRKDFFHLEASNFPRGSWTKGNLTTSLVKWMVDYLDRHAEQVQPGSLLEGLAA